MPEIEDIICTGVGIISCSGLNKQDFWKAITQSCLFGDHTDQHATTKHPYSLKPDLDWTIKHLKRKTFTTRMSELVLAASLQAFNDAGFEIEQHDPDRIGVLLGTGYGNFQSQYEVLRCIRENRPKSISPRLFSRFINNEPAGALAIELNLRGPNLTVSQGEVSAETAICSAVQLLQTQRIDALLVVGADECHPVINQSILQPTSDTIPPISQTSPPYLSEGAGALLLETKSSVRKRRASFYGRIAGYSIRYRDFSASITEALSSADIRIEDILFLITATPHNIIDAIMSLFPGIFPINRIKSLTRLTGSFPSAGMLQTVATMLYFKSRNQNQQTVSMTEKNNMIDGNKKITVRNDICNILQTAIIPNSVAISIVMSNMVRF